MRVTFCGTRGSTPASGPEFVRYGGHTSCVAVAHDGQPPSLVLDAGSGLRRVSRLLEGQAFSGSLLLRHLHLDHVQGLGFFGGADQGRVEVYLPAQAEPEALIARVIAPPIFPLAPGELRGNWSFHDLEPGWRCLESWSVLALDIPHGGGRSFCYRISDGSAALAYLSDHSPLQLAPAPRAWAGTTRPPRAWLRASTC